MSKPAPPEPVLLTVAEAGAMLRMSKTAVYTLIERGELQVVRPLGRSTRITRRSVLALVERRANGA